MSERPILFGAPMVRAILDGRKTQTRRLVKFRGAEVIEDRGKGPQEVPWPWSPQHDGWVSCPYGAPGDRLWVRETWRPQRDNQCERVTYAADGAVVYESDIPDSWRRPVAAAHGDVPSIHMPRWASRITLEVTGVRVERLCDISEEDARAEGVRAPLPHFGGGTAVGSFRTLWESVYDPDSWALNPWVWAVEFRRATP